MPQPPLRLPQMPGPARVLMGVFGFVFGGVGLCVLALMWGGESDFVPIPARMFGSLIAMAFLAFGGFMAFTALRRGGMGAINLPDAPGDASVTTPTPVAGGYVCPNCGAALGDKSYVSPMGDAKCSFCGRWFNVHGRSS